MLRVARSSYKIEAAGNNASCLVSCMDYVSFRLLIPLIILPSPSPQPMQETPHTPTPRTVILNHSLNRAVPAGSSSIARDYKPRFDTLLSPFHGASPARINNAYAPDFNNNLDSEANPFKDDTNDFLKSFS